MHKMVWFYHLLLLSLALIVAGQEPVELITLHGRAPEAFQGFAVPVQNVHLKEVSKSVLVAENWMRNHVLAHYPGTNITTIVAGDTLLCETDQEDNLEFILPCIKNLYHSLTRWGLQKEIKVSALFGSSCLHSSSDMYRVDLADTFLKPLLNFLQDINAPYLVNAPSQEHHAFFATHSNAMKRLGLLNLEIINAVVVTKPREAKPTSRKLSFIDSEVVYPFPARPTPLAPTHAPTGSSVPAYAAKTPLPPLVGDVSPPPFTLPFAPQLPPRMNPVSPHYAPHLPPCNPSGGGAVVPAPEAGVHSGLWCVAKPSVPPETLQEALDYACGEGGADCDAIQPNGNCYFPETVVAHASYAFNSYWQKTKRNGGTCGFGGTAMLINSDPSFRHCRFILA